MLYTADVAALVKALQNGNATLLAGAGCSMPAPTSLPSALAWKQLLIERLVKCAGLDPSHQAVQQLAQSSAVPAEAVFAELDSVEPELGVDLVRMLEDPARPTLPGPLHEMAASLVRSGSIRAIVTTNFDTCFERAVDADAVPTPWVIGDAWAPNAKVFKVHGSVDRPETLRYTFQRVGRGFADDDATGLRSLLEAPLVVLGYAGADPDVMRAATGGQPVWWLTRSAADGPKGWERLAQTRKVFVIDADFSAVTSHVLGMPSSIAGSDWLAAPTSARLTTLSVGSASVALSSLTYRGRVGDQRHAAFDDEVLEHLQEVARHDGVSPVFLLQSRAARAQFAGRPISGPVKAAWLFARAARKSRAPADVSAAADAVELTGRGLLPGVKVVTLPFHRWARLRTPSGPQRALLLFREARGWSTCLRRRTAEQLLTDAIAECDGDTYLSAICHKRRALARAGLHDSRWADDIDDALALVTFEGRAAEISDVERTLAACRLLTRDDIARARADLAESIARRKLTHQGGGRGRSEILLKAMRWPRFARLAVWLLYS